MWKFIKVIGIIAVLQLVSADYKGKNEFGVDIFTINLDLPEEQRFVEVSKYYKNFTLQILNQYMDLIPAPILVLA